jgi:aryl-alcohol dehydrogenase-like predicted oxidoreductase
MAVIPWSAVGSGRFRNPPQLQEAIDKGEFKEEDNNVKISRKLFEIGKRRGIESFAPTCFPSTLWSSLSSASRLQRYIFETYRNEGSADLKMLHQNIKSLEIKLTPEEFKEIEGKLNS